jgi:hypothetical protein
MRSNEGADGVVAGAVGVLSEVHAATNSTAAAVNAERAKAMGIAPDDMDQVVVCRKPGAEGWAHAF